MPAATAPWAGPPPKSPKATNPDIGWTVSKYGSVTPAGRGVGPAGGAEDDVEDGSAAPCSRRDGAQAVTKPAARSPSICRREIRPRSVTSRYRRPDEPGRRQPGKSVTLWRDRVTS